MKIGWIGLGKLGLPCALALAHYGRHQIIGYEANSIRAEAIHTHTVDSAHENALAPLLKINAGASGDADTLLTLTTSIKDVVARTDGIVFVAVQTPHRKDYGGEQPMPETTADFYYGHLRDVATMISYEAMLANKHITLVVISTVLPGTMRAEIIPLLDTDLVTLVYNPFFIAMGTTIHDFLDPEFVLLGSDSIPTDVIKLYNDLYANNDKIAQILNMEIEEAELTKVSYNTFISMKIVFANTLMEICHKMGMNVDVVTQALGGATRRVASAAYMTGGMGDGGACHPRDNIAMSHLASKLNLACNPFAFVTHAREEQSRWLTTIVRDEIKKHPELPVVILGKSYKPESNLTFGSPALLLSHQLTELGVQHKIWDPYVDQDDNKPAHHAAIFIIATKHEAFRHFDSPRGSVIIDPHRYVGLPSLHSDVRFVPIGENLSMPLGDIDDQRDQ